MCRFFLQWKPLIVFRRMCKGLVHFFNIKCLHLLSSYSGMPIFSNGLSCRLPVVLTREKFQKGNWNVRLHRGTRDVNKQSGEHFVTATLT